MDEEIVLQPDHLTSLNVAFVVPTEKTRELIDLVTEAGKSVMVKRITIDAEVGYDGALDAEYGLNA